MFKNSNLGLFSAIFKFLSCKNFARKSLFFKFRNLPLLLTCPLLTIDSFAALATKNSSKIGDVKKSNTASYPTPLAIKYCAIVIVSVFKFKRVDLRVLTLSTCKLTSSEFTTDIRFPFSSTKLAIDNESPISPINT